MNQKDPLASYRIETPDRIGAELARIARGEMDHIRQQFAVASADTGGAVHQCRKSIKRLRAIALFTRNVDRDRFRQIDTSLRDAGRALAAARDSSVISAAAHRIAGKVLSDEYASLAGDQESSSGAVGAALDRCAHALDRADSLLLSLIANEPRLQLTDIQASVVRTYGRAKGALERFRHSHSADDAHRFRRRVQRHLAQLRLIEPLADAALAARIAELDELSEMLGDHHDLALLHQLIHDGALGIDETHRKALLETVRREQKHIGKEARRRASTLFRASSKSFIDGLLDPMTDRQPQPGTHARGT